MKNNHYTLIFLLILIFCGSLSAQISLTNAVFPQPGDVLKTTNGTNLEGVVMTSGGDNQTWDYSQINVEGLNEDMFIDPSEGLNVGAYPNATLLISGQGGESYFKTNDNTFEFLGFAGGDPTGFGIELITHFQPALIESRAPLNYLDLHTYGSETNIPFSADALPGGFLDSLPIAPDSLRIRNILDRTDLVDAWGTITIPGGTYDVIRLKRVEYIETRLDIKLGGLPWLDVTDQFGDFGGGTGGMDFFGIDTTVTYSYLSNESKEPIAVFSLDGKESFVENATFKSLLVNPVDETKETLNPNLYAFPNPAINEVKFEFSNLKKGNYDLKIFNILGLEVYGQSYAISGSKTVKIDISRLRKGTYLYSLLDEKGKAITTKRLIVIRP